MYDLTTMSHPFGDLICQHLHRRHGLSQAKLAQGIAQDPSVISEMCRGRRLHGYSARRRVLSIIGWLSRENVLSTRDEAHALLAAAGMAPLDDCDGETVLLTAAASR